MWIVLYRNRFFTRANKSNMDTRKTHNAPPAPKAGKTIEALGRLVLPRPESGLPLPKSAEQLAVQRAVVCLYLRKRAARVTLSRQPDSPIAAANFCEAHNALESFKRVLWNHDWS